MNLITDDKLIKIKIQDNGEPLVDTRTECPDIFRNIGGYVVTETDSDVSNFVRLSVAKMINGAEVFLPENYKLMLRYGYRPPKIQKKMYKKVFNEFKKNNPEWTEKKTIDETAKCVAPIELASHCAGAAIDVTLCDNNGKEYDMGTEVGEFSEKSHTYSNGLTSEAEKNRKLLIAVMTKAGFINYPTEWWHWSYGDTYWAAELKKPFAIFGPYNFKGK